MNEKSFHHYAIRKELIVNHMNKKFSYYCQVGKAIPWDPSGKTMIAGNAALYKTQEDEQGHFTQFSITLDELNCQEAFGEIKKQDTEYSEAGILLKKHTYYKAVFSYSDDVQELSTILDWNRVTTDRLWEVCEELKKKGYTRAEQADLDRWLEYHPCKNDLVWRFTF
jgi:hypothetical protein